MIRSLLRAGVVAASAALVLTAAPAQAVTYDHDDATGDVRGATLFDDGGLSRQQQEKAADITQLRVRHGRHRLIMRLETVKLTRRSGQVIGPSFLIKTPTRRYSADLQAATFAGQTEREAMLIRPRGGLVRCPGLFTDFDFTGNVSMISVPRSCIGDPRRVTLKAVMVKIRADGEITRTSFPDFSIYLDSAMDDNRLRPVSSTPSIRSGPRRAV